MDGYVRGLNGQQTAWVARVYKGHRMVPMNILEECAKEVV